MSVAKPGIIFGNGISVVGGFFLASRGNVDLGLFVYTLLGISLVIASGGVFNNWIDRDIDRLMERTKNRALVVGAISGPMALLYAATLALLGLALLYTKTNTLTALVALAGLFFYVAIYSLWLKRTSIYGTLVGSFSGAVPPLVGYLAVSHQFDLAAMLLFLILCFWQMPHSYAIAIYRWQDFSAAHIPVLPLVRGIGLAKAHMLLYSVAFVVASLLLSFFGYTGIAFAVVVGGAGILWATLCAKGMFLEKNQPWAYQVFFSSLAMISVLCLMMSVDSRAV